MWIDSTTSTVWLLGENADTAAVDTARSRRPGEVTVTPGESLELPGGVEIELTRARARFRFASSGAVFADSLTLVTPSTRRLITLHPWTGDVVY